MIIRQRSVPEEGTAFSFDLQKLPCNNLTRSSALIKPSPLQFCPFDIEALPESKPRV